MLWGVAPTGTLKQNAISDFSCKPIFLKIWQQIKRVTKRPAAKFRGQQTSTSASAFNYNKAWYNPTLRMCILTYVQDVWTKKNGEWSSVSFQSTVPVQYGRLLTPPVSDTLCSIHSGSTGEVYWELLTYYLVHSPAVLVLRSLHT